jgi:hypothetical protein
MRLPGLSVGLGVLLAAAGCASQPANTASGEQAGGPAQSRPPADDRSLRPRNSVPSSTP